MKKKTYIILGAAALLLVIGLILTILLCLKNDPATDDIIDTVEEAEEILVLLGTLFLVYMLVTRNIR
jgi:hypothetical protein